MKRKTRLLGLSRLPQGAIKFWFRLKKYLLLDTESEGELDKAFTIIEELIKQTQEKIWAVNIGE